MGKFKGNRQSWVKDWVKILKGRGCLQEDGNSFDILQYWGRGKVQTLHF